MLLLAGGEPRRVIAPMLSFAQRQRVLQPLSPGSITTPA